ncbi:MAG: relaxase/mobilization nuclease domain-containing protein [Pseudomonadota bacterium]
MIPKAATGRRATGTSFRGVHQYINHDKREEGEEIRTSQDRVDWTATRNLASDDIETASRIMSATARQQDALKRAAGGSAAGNKSDQVVFHYSLSWHPSEKDGLTKSEMLRAADESLRAIGASNHQATIIAHNDEPQPHIHIVVNRVNPEDGKMLNLWGYKKNLSKWALGYERERGQVLCNERVNNWRERDNGQIFSADKWEPWHQYNQAANANDAPSKRLWADQKAKDAELSAKGEAMHHRHGQQWKDLSKNYKAEKDRIYESYGQRGQRTDQPTPFQKARADIDAQFKPLWRELYKSQQLERDKFHLRETRLKGKIENTIAAVHAARKRDPDSSLGFIASAFNFLISSPAREREMLAFQAAERGVLQSAKKATRDTAYQKIRDKRTKALKSHRDAFSKQREALIATQAAERSELRDAWQERKEERSRITDIMEARDHIRKQNPKTTASEKSRSQSDKFNRKRKPRSTGRKRKRVRKKD